MPSVNKFDMQGNALGSIELKEEIFGVAANPAILHQSVVRHQANMRGGNADTKTRAEVSGGGKKPWRQKGTGRARHGSTRSPIWRKGGVVWGPHPRSYNQSLNRKMRKLAIKVALSDKVRNNALTVLDKMTLDTFKTKQFVNVLDALKLDQTSLFVLGAPDHKTRKSADNLPHVKVIDWSELSTYDLLKYRRLVLTQDAVAAIEEAFQ
ncbi:MAG TPA: 50S ribosomal protein L4 [Candidatus Xenobia bacterium]|jgi:large subunit ribosomal protein L4